MKDLYLFFPTQQLKEKYVERIMSKIKEQALADIKNTDLFNSIKFHDKRTYRSIPGCWTKLEVCNEGQNNLFFQFIFDCALEVIPKHWVGDNVFFPDSMLPKKQMEKMWVEKYQLNDEDHDNAWKAFFKEAQSHFKQGKADIAFTVLMYIYRNNPYFLKKYRRYYIFEDLAYYYEAKGELHTSIRCLKAQARLQPNATEAYLNMSSFLILNGMNEQAIQVCKKGLKIKPFDEYLENNLLIAYLNEGWTETAIEFLNQKISIYPENPTYWKLMGDILCELGNYEGALVFYQEAKKCNAPSNGELELEICYGLGICYQETGQVKNAIRCFKKLLKQNNGDANVLLNLSKLYGEDLKKYDAARMYAEKITKIQPENGYGHHNLGLIYLCTGRLDKASWHLYKARKLIPEYEPVHDAIKTLKRLGRQVSSK